ncbi:MAG: arginase [Schleiferiaceae bacterium]|nr:arginase [Schleiferiaceae bacterium]
MKTHLYSVMSELGAGTRGSSLGLEALQIASLKYDRPFFHLRQVKQIETENHRLFRPTQEDHAKYLDGISMMYERIERELGSALEEKDHLPCVIAADHSNAGGTIAALKRAYPKSRLGVIWVDAHADLHSPYTSPSGHVHGMPLGSALGDDNLENQQNEPGEEAIWHWNEMKGKSPRLRPADIFFLGVRDTEAPEDKLMEKHQIPNLTVDQCRELGMPAAAEKALNHLQDCDIIYLSFDVDSLDPIVSVGTGTPVDDGYTEEEARELLLHLVIDQRLAAFEMVEINPLLDMNGNSMAEAAFRIFKPVVEKIESQST